jgi:hypothetical protein
MTPAPEPRPRLSTKALRATRSDLSVDSRGWLPAGRSVNINTNNNRREVGPLQASAVGPVQTAAPNSLAGWRPTPVTARNGDKIERQRVSPLLSSHEKGHSAATAATTRSRSTTPTAAGSCS